MKKNKEYIDYEELNKPINLELNDYREERRLMKEELERDAAQFAQMLKDNGSDIKKEIAEKANAKKEPPKKNKKKFSDKIKSFIEKLNYICK